MKIKTQKCNLIFIILFMTGCNEGCEFTMGMNIKHQLSLLNNTKDTILFYFSEKFDYDMVDTIICNPYSENIFVDATIGYVRPEYRPCHPYIEEILGGNAINSITIVTSSSRKLKKDITKNHNWYCGENLSYLYKIVFEINEEDLE